MAYRITEECVKCGSCELHCLNQAISEGQETYMIDPDKCTECVGNFESPKCAEICPLGACVPDPDHVEGQKQLLLDKWRKLHPDESPVI